MEREQKAYAKLESGAQRKILNTFVSIPEAKDGREEVWAGKMLLLLRCSVRGESDKNGLAFLRSIECGAPWMRRMGLLSLCVCSGRLPASGRKGMI